MIGPQTARRWVRHLLRHVACDAAVLGADRADRADRPRAEAVFGVHGSSPAAVSAWCEGPEPLLEEAGSGSIVHTRAGVSVAAGGPLGGAREAVLATQASWPGSSLRWFLLVGRRDRVFTERERERVGMVLSIVRDRFESPREADLCQTVLRDDGEVVLIDAPTGLLLTERPQTCRLRFEVARRIGEQRWGAAGGAGAARGPRDVVVDLDDGLGPVWMRSFSWRAAPRLPRLQWIQHRPVGDPGPPPVGVLEDDRIARAVAVLGERYGDPPGLKSLSEELGMSMYHFQRLFSGGVGCSPKQYTLRVQLMMARWMLRTSSRSVGEVAAATGFGTPGHFSSTFKDHTGVTPTDYRAVPTERG